MIQISDFNSKEKSIMLSYHLATYVKPYSVYWASGLPLWSTYVNLWSHKIKHEMHPFFLYSIFSFFERIKGKEYVTQIFLSFNNLINPVIVLFCFLKILLILKIYFQTWNLPAVFIISYISTFAIFSFLWYYLLWNMWTLLTFSSFMNTYLSLTPLIPHSPGLSSPGFSGYFLFIFPGFHDFLLLHVGASLCSTLICHSSSLLTFFPSGILFI